jgi:membrane protease subunit (stomatin/prohibitin family)
VVTTLNQQGGAAAAIIGSLIVLGGVAAVIFFIVRAMPQQKAKMAAQQAQWQYAQHTWNQLYYCHRCGGVFLPGGQSPLIPTEQMMAFLYSTPMGYLPTP